MYQHKHLRLTIPPLCELDPPLLELSASANVTGKSLLMALLILSALQHVGSCRVILHVFLVHLNKRHCHMPEHAIAPSICAFNVLIMAVMLQRLYYCDSCRRSQYFSVDCHRQHRFVHGNTYCYLIRQSLCFVGKVDSRAWRSCYTGSAPMLLVDVSCQAKAQTESQRNRMVTAARQYACSAGNGKCHTVR